MEKVVMLIWQFRDDPAVVQFMAQFVGKVCLLDLMGCFMFCHVYGRLGCLRSAFSLWVA